MRGKALVRATIIISLISPDFLIAMAYIALAGPNAGYFNMVIREGSGLEAARGRSISSRYGASCSPRCRMACRTCSWRVVPALRNMDPALDEAARLQGATAVRAIRDVTIPLMRPALLSGALLAFAGSLAMFGPPHMLRLNVLTIATREALVRLDFKAASVTSSSSSRCRSSPCCCIGGSTRQAERFRTLGGKLRRRATADIGASCAY